MSLCTMQGISNGRVILSVCIARYNLIYTQATARWKFGDTLGYSETCCYVDRSKNFKLGNWVFVADVM